MCFPKQKALNAGETAGSLEIDIGKKSFSLKIQVGPNFSNPHSEGFLL